MFAGGFDDEDETPAATTSDADLEALLQARCEVAETPPLPLPRPPAPAPAPPAAASEATVELGFLSWYPGGAAQPEHFPSKVGGAPVWLVPERLPTAADLCCRSCGRQLRFLMQLYCPRPEMTHAYHRSLMLFCCGGPCLQSPRGWRALRCNLPEACPWYSENADGSWSAQGREQLNKARGDGSAELGSSPAADAATASVPSPPPLPELLVSIDLEGDWHTLVAGRDRDAQSEVQRLLAAYEEGEAAKGEGGELSRGSARAERDSEGSTADDDEALAEEVTCMCMQRRAVTCMCTLWKRSHACACRVGGHMHERAARAMQCRGASTAQRARVAHVVTCPPAPRYSLRA